MVVDDLRCRGVARWRRSRPVNIGEEVVIGHIRFLGLNRSEGRGRRCFAEERLGGESSEQRVEMGTCYHHL